MCWIMAVSHHPFGKIGDFLTHRKPYSSAMRVGKGGKGGISTHLGNHIAVPWTLHVKLPLLSGSLPPRVKASAEVLLSPWAQSQLAVHGGGVSQGQGKWGRATHHLALLIVLGSMARAAELVGSLVPGHDAAKVSAHGQECEVLDVVRSGDEVVRLTLQSLHQLTVVVLVALHPRIKGHRIAINISCKLSTTATTCHRRHEVPQIAAQCHQDWDASGGHQDKVHELSAPYKSTQKTQPKRKPAATLNLNPPETIC